MGHESSKVTSSSSPILMLRLGYMYYEGMEIEPAGNKLFIEEKQVEIQQKREQKNAVHPILTH